MSCVCSSCGGTGKVEEDAWAGPVIETCQMCGGTGKDPDCEDEENEEYED